MHPIYCDPQSYCYTPGTDMYTHMHTAWLFGDHPRCCCYGLCCQSLTCSTCINANSIMSHTPHDTMHPNYKWPDVPMNEFNYQQPGVNAIPTQPLSTISSSGRNSKAIALKTNAPSRTFRSIAPRTPLRNLTNDVEIKSLRRSRRSLTRNDRRLVCLEARRYPRVSHKSIGDKFNISRR